MELTEELKKRIWNKGIEDEKYPSERVRKDACGAYMFYDDFGDRESLFGWEIDHIYPASKLKERTDVSPEEIDNIDNLRPLHWKNNASKGADYPFYTACLIADEEHATNVEKNVGKVVNERVQAVLRELYNLVDQPGNGSGL